MDQQEGTQREAVPGALKSQVSKFLEHLDVKDSTFATRFASEKVCDKHPLTHSQWDHICDGIVGLTPSKLGHVTSRLQWFLDEKIKELKTKNVGALALLECTLRQDQRITFLQFKDSIIVDESLLERLYVKVVKFTIKFEKPPEGISPDTGFDFFMREIEKGTIDLNNLKEGCTEVTFIIPAEQAATLREAFARGSLGNEITNVFVSDDFRRTWIERVFGSVSRPINILATDAREQFRREWRRLMFREECIRPWRRLRFLFSRSVESCPLANVIGESNSRAYAIPEVRGRFKSLIVDLRMTLVLWPLAAAIFLAALFFGLPSALSPAAIFLGIATGFTLALFGSQPCSALISPLACGGGTVVMGIAFSAAHAVAFGRLESGIFSAENIRHDAFVSVVGGIVGLSAPEWPKRLAIPSIVFLIACVALSIAGAAWLMAQPGRAQRRRRIDNGKVVFGAFLGTCAGGGIGAVLGLTHSLQARTGQAAAFILSFVLVASIWMFLSTYLRTRSWLRGVTVSFIHSVAAILLLSIAFSRAGTPVGLAALAASCGFFHSTFFTTAFVVGEWRGGTTAGFVAAALEGAVGFTAFVVSRMV